MLMIDANLLFVGDVSENSRSFQRYLSLKKLFKVVDVLHNFDSSRRSITTYEYWSIKAGFPPDPYAINKRFLYHIRSSRYSYVWIEKNLCLLPQTLHIAKILNPNLKLYSYSEDDMFRFLNRSTFYTSCLKYYDVVITTKSYNANCNELPALGAKKIVVVDKAFDPKFYYPASMIDFPYKIKHKNLVSFVGSYESHRAHLIHYISNKGIQVNVWGNGWSKCRVSNPNMILHKFPLNIDQYRHVVSNSLISLCFLRKSARDLQTARTIEIPACAGLMLAERTEEQLRLFSEESEALYFAPYSPSELYKQVCRVLRRPEYFIPVRLNGYFRALSSAYTHYDRLIQIFESEL